MPKLGKNIKFNGKPLVYLDVNITETGGIAWSHGNIEDYRVLKSRMKKMNHSIVEINDVSVSVVLTDDYDVNIDALVWAIVRKMNDGTAIKNRLPFVHTIRRKRYYIDG